MTENERQPCPRCNDTGEQRYWESRWRDEKVENDQLRYRNEVLEAAALISRRIITDQKAVIEQLRGKQLAPTMPRPAPGSAAHAPIASWQGDI